MSILGVIPSRYASTRFPGKALIQINGKSMIRRVYEQAQKSKLLDKVIVATDDQRIFDEIATAGGEVVMTNSHHRNGTERCGEISALHPGYEYIINIQGDEPYIHPEQIDTLAAMLDGSTELATLAKRVEDEAVLDDPTEIKVVFSQQQEALYFSRTCIPYLRDFSEDRMANHTYYKHIGIYAYRRDILQRIIQLAPTPLETGESLEQLRWLENGLKIRISITDLESQMIDTPADLLKLTYL